VLQPLQLLQVGLLAGRPADDHALVQLRLHLPQPPAAVLGAAAGLAGRGLLQLTRQLLQLLQLTVPACLQQQHGGQGLLLQLPAVATPGFWHRLV
jgi:hypothetical protein